VLLDEEHRQPAPTGQGQDGPLDLGDHGGLDAFGGLVQQQHGGRGDECPGDGELLALPAGEQPGPPAEQTHQSGEQVQRLGHRALAVCPAVGDELQVLGRGQVREALLSLGYVGHPARDPLVRGQAGDVLAGQPDRPLAGLEQTDGGPQQGALAGAVVPEHGGHPVDRYGERNPVQHNTSAVSHVDVVELQHHASRTSAGLVPACPR
jgi:hypothetical protein